LFHAFTDEMKIWIMQSSLSSVVFAVSDAGVFVLFRTILCYRDLFFAGSWLPLYVRLGIDFCRRFWPGNVAAVYHWLQ